MTFLKRLFCLVLALSLLQAGVFADETEKIPCSGHAYIEAAYAKSNHSGENVIKVGGKGQLCARGYVFFKLDNIPSANDKYVLTLTPYSVTGGKTITVHGYKYQDRSPADMVYVTEAVSTGNLGSSAVSENTAFSVDVSAYVKSSLTQRGNIAFMLAGDDKEEAYFKPSDIYLEVIPGGAAAVISDTKPAAEGPSASDQNSVRASQVKERKWPEIGEISEYADIDDYTTTYYKPWLLNYHFTEPVQFQNDYYGGETGQRLTAGAIAYKSNNKLLLGYDTEGIYRSDDGGVTWRPSQNGLKTVSVVSIAYHPDDDNTVFAMMARMDNKFSNAVGIFKSTDGGENWRHVHNMPSHYGYHYELFAFGEPKKGVRTIYAGTLAEGGVLCSYDNGETWKEIGLEGKTVTALKMCENELVASTMDGIYVTSDDGKTWEARNSGLTGTPIDPDDASAGYKYTVYSFTFDPDKTSDWYCGVATELFVSHDRGKTWEYMCNSKDMDKENLRFYNLKFGAKYPDGHRRFFATLHGQWIYRYSDDYGKTWKNENIHNEKAFFEDNWGSGPQPLLTSYDNPDLMWVMMGDENYKSTDGGENIYPSASGCSGLRAVAFWVNPEDGDDMLIGTTDYGVMRTIPSGNGELFPLVTNYSSEDRFWIRYQGARSVYGVDVDPRDRNRVIISVGGWNKSILKESLDGGLTFTAMPGSEGTNAFVHFNRNNPDIIYSGQRISYDNGKTWQTAEFAIKGISPVNNDIVYANAAGGIRKSADCGKTWTVIAPGVMNAQSITPDSVTEDKLYVGTLANGIVICENGKLTYKTAADGLGVSGLGTSAFYYIAQDPSDPLHLVTCGQDQIAYSKSAGVYESRDGGVTWKHIEGLPGSGDAWFVYYHPTQQKVYIATSNGTFVYLPERYYDLSEHVYSDTSESFAEKQIEKLYDDGIWDKYTNGYFRPKDDTRRFEAALALQKILKTENRNYKQIYSDVSLFSRYYTATASLFEAGVTEIDGDMLFKPYEKLKPSELKAMITKVLRIKGLYTQNNLNTVFDGANLSGDTVTRENLAVILCNLTDVIK